MRAVTRITERELMIMIWIKIRTRIRLALALVSSLPNVGHRLRSSSRGAPSGGPEAVKRRSHERETETCPL